MKEIPLTRGKVALVDDVDYPEISRFKWCFEGRYAKAYLGKVDGRYRTDHMHKLILGKREGHEIDHINGNKLDNRRANLRFVTRGQNIRNNFTRSNSISGYKGVTWSKFTGSWRADIEVDGRQKHIGRFHDKHEAAAAWNKSAKELYGEFARLNEMFDKTGIIIYTPTIKL